MALTSSLQFKGVIFIILDNRISIDGASYKTVCYYCSYLAI